ncbi:MAG: Ig-like domain-containing protein, partial [Mycobacteriales bacterium]
MKLQSRRRPTSGPTRLRAFLVGSAALSLLVVPWAAAPAHAATYALVYSTSADRAAPVGLDGAAVGGSIYVFTTPDTSVSKVDFFLDNPAASGTPFHTEGAGPFDFVGTSGSLALPYNTSSLTDGGHSITAKVTLSGGAAGPVLTGNFTVSNSTNNGPAAPTGVLATAGDTQVSLSWNAAAGAVGYNVFRSTTSTVNTSGAPVNGATKITGTTFVNTGLTNDTTYYYVVQSVDSQDRSALSSTVSATPVAAPTQSDIYSIVFSTSANRSAPLPLSSASVSGNIYAFTTPTTNVSKVVFYLDDPTRSGTPYHTETWRPFDFVGGTDTTALPFDTASLTDGTHRISAVFTLTGGAAGPALTATFTVGNASSSPAAPVVTPSAGNGVVSLSWGGVAGVTGYNVFRSTTSTVNTTGTPLNGATKITGTSYTDTAVVNGTTYYYVVQAVGSNGLTTNSAVVSATPNPPNPQPGSVSAKINFSNSTFVPPTGYLRDFGEALSSRTGPEQGTGYTYGWVTPGTNTPLSLVGNGRDRAYSGQPDRRLASLMHMQGGDYASFPDVKTPGSWAMLVPNGWYAVTVAVGDAGGATNSQHTINVENQNAIWRFQPTSNNQFDTATATVNVTDNYLTVSAAGGTNTKIDYLTIDSVANTSARPSVTQVAPVNTESGARRDVPVTVSVAMPTVGAGIDGNTLTSSTVSLVNAATGAQVNASLNTTGGGDAIILQPTTVLAALTTYRFTVTTGVKDTVGASFLPWSSVFTTGTTGGPTGGTSASFAQFPQATTAGELYTTLVMGPDGNLYAAGLHGVINRFPIGADGTLGTPTAITTVVDNEGGPRNLIGLAFAPGSTAANPTLWISSSADAYSNAPDWSGSIAKLTGANLTTYAKIVSNLPRSVSDHQTNDISFGPDGALYFAQGSMSSLGAADSTWGLRPEHPLSAAVLRLDPTQITSAPLDAKTADGGGTYNPKAAGAPLTIYASGVRNAYDLLWHSNGSLYAPTNGGSAGGNTPSTPSPLPAACSSRIDAATNGNYTGPAVTGLTNVADTQKDYLFKIVKGGYYGHPNPTGCEWVLNGGNPTAAVDPGEVAEYPVGTLPDRNWRGAAYDFGLHYSPNGVIEYQSSASGGALKNWMLITRYSAGSDVIAMKLGAGGVVTDVEVGIPGFTDLGNPLGIVENPANGNIYVSSLGNAQIVLLKPGTPPASVSAPTNVAATPGNGTVALSWTAGTGATGYNVFRSTTSPVATTGTPLSGATPITATSYTDNAVTNGTTYYYIVQSVGAGGATANSTQVQATPTAPTPGGALVVSSPDDAILGLPGSRLVFSTYSSSATPAKALTLTNTGTASITVSDIAIGGTNPGSYRLAAGQPTTVTLAAGASATVNVLFTPTAATNCPTTASPNLIANMEQYATLSFTTNSATSPTGSASLAGVNACGPEGNFEPVLAQVTRALGY